MNKFKAKDIIVAIVAGIIFVVALAFMLDGMSGSGGDKTQPDSKDIINEADFNDKYNEEALKSIEGLKDFGLINLNSLCKGSLFSIEEPLPEGSVCYALQKLGLTDTATQDSQNTANAEETSRNNERKQIVEDAKEAIDSYKQKNNDYPEDANNFQLSTLLKEGGILNAFLTSDSKKEDPSGDNTRLCYAKRSSTQYWLYYVAEPTEAPEACLSEDPKDIEGVIDFSVR